MILAPQLAEPLHGERGGRHHQAALDAAGVDQAVEDEARLDRLAEPHLVGQQPAHRVAGRGALGGVELVREEPHAAAEERAQAAGFADAPQAQDVEAVLEVARLVDVAVREALEQLALERGRARSRVDGNERVGAGGEPQRRAGSRKLDNERAPLESGDTPDAEIGIETVREVVARGPDWGHPIELTSARSALLRSR